MAELQLITKYDGKLMPSGNPIIVQAGISGFYLNTYFIQVTIQYGLLNKTVQLYSDNNIYSLDISSICDAYLEYFVPDYRLDNLVECTDQIKTFTVIIDLFNKVGQDREKIATVTDTIRVIKAGVNYEYFYPVDGALFYKNEEFYLFPPITVDGDFRERIFSDDYFWLYFLLPKSASQYFVHYLIKYLDNSGTEQTLTAQLYPPIQCDANSNKLMCLPGGFEQNKFGSLLPDGATVIEYQFNIFRIVAGSPNYGNLVPVKFEIEQRNFYNTKKLIYRTSQGSLLPVTVRGNIENSASYDNEVNDISSSAWMKDKNILPVKKQSRSVEDYKFSGDTGFITKEEADRMRDFFVSEERYEIKDSKLVPIIVNSKSIKFPPSQPGLCNISFEWQHAFNNRFYTPYDSYGKACPALFNFSWKQWYPGTLQVFYWLPPGYNYLRVIVEVPGKEAQYFYLSGIGGGASSIFFDGPDAAMAINVSAQVMCNRFNRVPDYGPLFITDPQEVDPAAGGLVAGNDLFTIQPGFTSPVILTGSILANDVDPAGGEIEVVEVTDAATTQGGTISITAAGIVTYTPPSAGFTGDDTFIYQIQNVGETNTVEGTITIRVANNSTAVLPRAAVYNDELTNNGFGGFYYNKHYIALYLGESGIIGLNFVNGDNVTVNYKKIVTTTTYGAFESTNTVETNLTVLINGVSKVLVATGNMNTDTLDINTGIRTVKQTSFEVLPGTGYTVV